MNTIEGVPEGYELVNGRSKLPPIDNLRAVFDYDEKNGKLFWKVARSNRLKVGDEAGWVDGNGYRRVNVDGVDLQVHRIVYKLHTGAEPPKYIDHADGNRLNNKFCNLRPCTHSQNLANTDKRRTNKSGRKGVHWSSSKRKWQVNIGFANRTIYVGRYSTLEEASQAYDFAAARLFGEYAKLNVNALDR